MKKIIFGTLLIAASFCNLSMYRDPTLGIIDQYDIKLAEEMGPSLSSAIGDESPWAVYSEWQCFSTEDIRLQTIKYCRPEGCDSATDYDVPSVGVELAGHYHQFDYDFESSDETQEILSEWQSLIQNQKGICLYAALLPTFIANTGDPTVSLWTLFNMKTKSGVWRENYIPYLKEENDEGPVSNIDPRAAPK